MPPTPNVAPPTQPEQPGVLESLANKALETPMTRRGFLETTGRAAASQMLKPKIDLGLFNESPLTQAAELAPQATPMSIATAAANFVSKQLNSPEFESVTNKIKGILQENGYRKYVDELDEEPSLLFAFIDASPYMDVYEPHLRNQITNIIDNFIGVKRLAEDSGIPLDVLHANGITDIALQGPLETVSHYMRSELPLALGEGWDYTAVDVFDSEVKNDDVERIIDAELAKYPADMSIEELEDEGAISGIYDDLRELFVDRFSRPNPYKSDETNPHDLLHEELYKQLSDVAVKDLTGVAHQIFSVMQDHIGPLEEFIRQNISLRRENKPLKSIKDILEDDNNYYHDDYDDE